MRKKRDIKSAPSQETQKKIRWLLVLRLFILFFLIVATVSIQQKKDIIEYYLKFIYTLISISFAFTIVSIYWLKKIKRDVLFGYVQLIWDVMFVSALIYLTGGFRSIFSFLYILSIINASIILMRLGSFIIAAICSLAYSALLLLENYKFIKYAATIVPDYLASPKSSDTFLKMFINISAFFMVAYLSSYLAEQLRKTGEELKEFKLDYQELEAINRNIVQSINSGLITINKDHFITFLNHSAEDLTGYSLAKAYNMNINDIFKGINLDAKKADRVINRFEFKHLKDNGKELYLGFSLSNLKDMTGKDEGKILIFQDLTKIKEMEERLKVNDKLAAIGKMAAGIAHEIRNPMASISASIQMLKHEKALDEDNRKLMDIILRETDRLNALITDLLLFAKPTKSEKEIVTLSVILNETIELLMHSQAYNQGIRVIKDFDDDIAIKADSNQLKQIFFNLFINSLEAMPKKGELKLATRKMRYKRDKNSPEAEYAEIVVKDTGAGVPPDIADRIFDPFFTTKEQGTGLGLAIVYRIIENHKGEIYLDTEVAEGAEFHVLLPIEIT